MFTPGCNQCVDEAMVKFKGHSSIKQYMQKKPIKRGFKIWMRSDSRSGYVCDLMSIKENKKIKQKKDCQQG